LCLLWRLRCLGVIEDSGVIAENAQLQNQFDSSVYKGINDAHLRKILHLSLLQQQEAPAPSSAAAANMITGLVAKQPADSSLSRDARFSALFTTQGGGSSGGESDGGGGNTEIRALLLLLRSESADPVAKLKATAEVISGCFSRLLRLSEPMDPARPLSVYGIDSLAAVEVRNWVRTELGALVTTLDIMNAASLTTFSEKLFPLLTNTPTERRWMIVDTAMVVHHFRTHLSSERNVWDMMIDKAESAVLEALGALETSELAGLEAALDLSSMHEHADDDDADKHGAADDVRGYCPLLLPGAGSCIVCRKGPRPDDLNVEGGGGRVTGTLRFECRPRLGG
ncbi:putative mycocerosic acid synthase, partial [Colletotrichum sublineola]